MSAKPTYSAPAAFAASAAAPPRAKTRTRTVLPLPWGNGTVPRTIWSDCFGSTPRRNARSIVSLNFAFGNFARTPTASFNGYVFFASTTSSAFLNRLLGILLCAVHASFWLSRDCVFNLTDNFNSHAARGSRNDAERRFFVRRVHVLGLHLDDVQNLFARHFADFVLVRHFRAGGDASRFFQQNGRRRRLGNERERLVLINGDDEGNHESGVVFCRRVKFFAERHDVDAVLTERRADGRRGICLTCGNLQFNVSSNLLCHKIN